jgi:hypothetical protein
MITTNCILYCATPSAQLAEIWRSRNSNVHFSTHTSWRHILKPDNIRTHTARLCIFKTKVTFKTRGKFSVSFLLSSLFPSIYHLFGPFKEHMKGNKMIITQKFRARAHVDREHCSQLHLRSIFKHVQHWRKFLDCNVCYGISRISIGTEGDIYVLYVI